ncbi:MAG TPA: hypothetical protein VGI74_17485 [Streptosporangiaceae bacterium]
MLLVVVGLLVLVLVILVVVFLSVRSMRDAEEDDYEDRPAPRRPARGSRGDDEDAAPRGASRGRQSGSPARRGPAGESWQNDRDDAYGRPAAVEPADYSGDDAGSSQRRSPALPRPRGYQHDQDQPEEPRRAARSQPRQAAVGRRSGKESAVGRGSGKESAVGRRSGKEGTARLTGGDRDRAGKDWSDTDWGGVSDEQYWAELSSDKPLATTARSAQPASADRAATAAMAAAGTHTARFGPDEDVAAPDAAPATDSWAAGERRTFGDPLSMSSQSRLADLPGVAESNDTDPGLGGQADWPGAAGDSTSTAAWPVPETGSPQPRDWEPQEPQDASWGPHDPSVASGTGWHGSDNSATAAWTAQDAAVAAGANWADEPSAADWGGPEHSGPAWNGDHATPAWNDDEQAARSWNSPEDPLTSPSFSMTDGYASDSRSYRRSHDEARAQQESSPDVFGGAQADYAGSHGTGSHGNSNGYPAGDWPGSGDDYPPGQLEPLPEPGGSPAAPHESWHPAPVSAEDSRFYTDPATPSWDQGGTGYDDAPRHRSDRQGQDDGYSSQGYRDWQGSDDGYQQSSGYEPSHGQGHSNGYSPGYGQSSADYEPGHDSAGYGDGADRDDSGYGQASYGSNGNGYGLPTRDSGPAVNGYGHEQHGRGQHSGYDNDRWQ